jgi:hypothetical protein
MFSIEDTFGNISKNLPTGILKYGIVVASMCLFIYVLYLASKDPTAIFTSSYIYAFVLNIKLKQIILITKRLKAGSLLKI